MCGQSVLSSTRPCSWTIYSEASYHLHNLRKTNMGIELKTLIEDTCRQFERNFSAGRTLSKPRSSVSPGKSFFHLDAAANQTRRLDQLLTSASGTFELWADVRSTTAI